MPNIAEDVFGELAGIGRNVIRSLREDLLSPIHSLSDLESLQKRVMGQHKIIRATQDELSYNSSVIMELERENAQLNQLLVDKNKELEATKSMLKSREFQLLEQTSRNMRKR